MRDFSIARGEGGIRASAGLGNQAIPMAKAWIGAQLFGLSYVEVPWALNPRGYRSELQAPRTDWLRSKALEAFSRDVIAETDYLASGQTSYADFLKARYGPDGPRHSIVHASGMHGGFASVLTARSFLRARFLGTRANTRSASLMRLDELALSSVHVAIHFRAGDFESSPVLPGTFNRRLPSSWYVAALQEIAGFARGRLHVSLVCEPSSDAQQLARSLVQDLSDVDITVETNAPTVDLAILTRCDILVCSVSSFSMLAAFLSDSAYVWYAPHLTRSIDGSEIWPPSMRPPVGNRSGPHKSIARGVPFPSAHSLEDVVLHASDNVDRRRAENDLVLYGTSDAM